MSNLATVPVAIPGDSAPLPQKYEAARAAIASEGIGRAVNATEAQEIRRLIPIVDEWLDHIPKLAQNRADLSATAEIPEKGGRLIGSRSLPLLQNHGSKMDALIPRRLVLRPAMHYQGRPYENIEVVGRIVSVLGAFRLRCFDRLSSGLCARQTDRR